MAVTRVEDRVCCAFGLSPGAELRFESCQSVPMGGVLLLLPFLVECGLLSYRAHYSARCGYYNFDSLLITLSFLYLLRIRSIEQGKQYNPGEFGKLIGYDRIPEVKKLRGMVRELTGQNASPDWSKALSKQWIGEETPGLYYIDGHVQVYHGHLAELGKKHVSRQRLCLPGMMEFWVNSPEGLPFFVVTAEVNEKMMEMLEKDIIPRLVGLHRVSEGHREAMSRNPDYPLFTLVFDREGYSPPFFKRLWDEHRIAVLTYRKNVKDEWDVGVFGEMEVETRLGDSTMLLHEERITIDGCPLREIRRLCPGGHQTSIVTTNFILATALLAAHMFGRWVRENFFRYLRQDFSLDKIIQYSTNKIDESFVVINREYSNIQYVIKKEREKPGRLKANYYDHQEGLEEKNEGDGKRKGKWLVKQLELQKQIEDKENEIKKLISQRKGIPYRIPVGRMPESYRYCKLDQESKLFSNIVKMICYRAETALARLLTPHYKRAEDEVRTLAKAIMKQTIDIDPDYKKNLLTITIYPLSNNRSNRALANIIEQVNRTETIFPGSNLTMNFKIATL